MYDSFEHLLQRLMENEIAICGLYDQFAETFSLDSKFWKELSGREKEHARWIEVLGEIVRKDKMGVGTVFSVKAVDTSIKFINIMREKCRKGEIARMDAYTIAHDIERSLIEKRFFSVFGLGSPVFKKIMENLTVETEEHRGMIDEMLHTIKNHKPE
ncbi:MAG: hypothetical protein ACYC9O_00365 [Candidatus Latescibacterota bacterium]